MDAAQHKAEVGGRLRLAIEGLGLSYASVARAFDISQSKLGNWMRGSDYPSEWFIYQFCNRHPITADWIYLGRVAGVQGELGDALFGAASASPEAPTAATRLAPKRHTASQLK